MRFLDAELQPLTLRRAASPLLLAVLITATTAGLALLSGRDGWMGLQMFPAVLVGTLMAQAGIVPTRSPWAMLASVPVLCLLFAASGRIAAMLTGAA